MSPIDPRERRAGIDALANALQGAVNLAALVRRDAQATADDAVQLEGTLARGPNRGGR